MKVIKFYLVVPLGSTAHACLITPVSLLPAAGYVRSSRLYELQDM
jgi:hypothetical protein